MRDEQTRYRYFEEKKSHVVERTQENVFECFELKMDGQDELNVNCVYYFRPTGKLNDRLLTN